MRIQVKMVGDITSKQGPKKAYNVFELLYKSGDKTYSKNIMEFSKEAFDALKGAKKDQWFEVTTEKSADGKYSNWVKVEPAEEGAPATASAPAERATKSGWQPDPNRETPEERAKKQVYIVRQNALTNAVALCGPKVKLDDILATAEAMEAWVFRSLLGDDKPEHPDGWPTSDDDIS